MLVGRQPSCSPLTPLSTAFTQDSCLSPLSTAFTYCKGVGGSVPSLIWSFHRVTSHQSPATSHAVSAACGLLCLSLQCFRILSPLFSIAYTFFLQTPRGATPVFHRLPRPSPLSSTSGPAAPKPIFRRRRVPNRNAPPLLFFSPLATRHSPLATCDFVRQCPAVISARRISFSVP